MAQLVWLVTGCSSGLGEALVHAILDRGDKVIATSRNAAERLSLFRETSATILDLDVTSPQAEIDYIIQDAIAIYGGIDVLVPNAGYSELAFLEDLSQAQWLDQLKTNFFGATNVTRALLPHFRQRKAGKIAFTSSIYGWLSDPACGPYAVSKHAIDAFAKTLRLETTQFGIQTIIFNIGYMRTKFTSNAKITPPTAQDYEANFKALMKASATMPGNQPGDPSKCAQRMIDVIKSEGMASGRPMPLQLPIGPDAKAAIVETCLAILKTCEDWDDLISSTDFDGPKQGYWAVQNSNQKW